MTPQQTAQVEALAALSMLETLGRMGFVVGICCGPIGRRPFGWTVTTLTPGAIDSPAPREAASFEDAVHLACVELGLGPVFKGARS